MSFYHLAFCISNKKILEFSGLNEVMQLNSLQVLLNQIVLGPSVIAVVFAWNNFWQGKLSQLPDKYKKDALPTLLYGHDHFELFFLLLQLCHQSIISSDLIFLHGKIKKVT